MPHDKFSTAARFAEQFADHLVGGSDISMRLAKNMYDFWYAEFHPEGAPKASASLIAAMRRVMDEYETRMQPDEKLDLKRIIEEAGGDPTNRSHQWHVTEIAGLHPRLQTHEASGRYFTKRITQITNGDATPEAVE